MTLSALLAQKPVDRRRQVRQAKGQRHRQAQAPPERRLGIRRGRIEFGDVGQQFDRARVVAAPRLGQAGAARGAVDQAHAQPTLQLRQATADPRFGDTELLGRLAGTVREYVERERNLRHDFETDTTAENRKLHAAEDEIRAASDVVHVTTDDGSYGEKGLGDRVPPNATILFRVHLIEVID